MLKIYFTLDNILSISFNPRIILKIGKLCRANKFYIRNPYIKFVKDVQVPILLYC